MYCAKQVDLLIQERKEAQAAAKSDESSKRQKEADDNAYLSLMPLALPAPTPPANDFAGQSPCPEIQSFICDSGCGPLDLSPSFTRTWK